MLCNVIFRLSSAHSQRADKKESVQSCLWQQMPMAFPAASGSTMEMVRWALGVLPLVTTPGSKKCPSSGQSSELFTLAKGGTLFSVGFAFSDLLARKIARKWWACCFLLFTSPTSGIFRRVTTRQRNTNSYHNNGAFRCAKGYAKNGIDNLCHL